MQGREPSELPIRILPLAFRRDRFDDVPVLDNFPVFDTEEIVKGGVDSFAKRAFADYENEVPLARTW